MVWPFIFAKQFLPSRVKARSCKAMTLDLGFSHVSPEKRPLRVVDVRGQCLTLPVPCEVFKYFKYSWNLGIWSKEHFYSLWTLQQLSETSFCAAHPTRFRSLFRFDRCQLHPISPSVASEWTEPGNYIPNKPHLSSPGWYNLVGGGMGASSGYHSKVLPSHLGDPV